MVLSFTFLEDSDMAIVLPGSALMLVAWLAGRLWSRHLSLGWLSRVAAGACSGIRKGRYIIARGEGAPITAG